MSAATPWIDCPLRSMPLYLPHTKYELALVQFLKRREMLLQEGDMPIQEGQSDTRLLTLLEGWGYRFKTLSDGRRQILNSLLAGDFIGVQQKMGDQASHGVVMLTAARLCVLHRNQPTMGFNITWLNARKSLSLAHSNKTLRKLQRRGLFRIADLYGDGRPPSRPLV